MIYSNDDTDKEIRRRNYFITVFGIPVITALAIVGITYVAYSNQYISEMDRNYCYFLAFGIGAFLFAMNKQKWLKIPDGSHYRVQKETSPPYRNFAEPFEYDKVYYISKISKTISIVAGIAIVGMGIFIYGSNKSYIIPVIIIMSGLFSIYNGIKGLLDRTPKLKLSTKGLWTDKLGFVDWSNVSKANVITETSGENSSLILEIYLKDTVFHEANYPDERLQLDDIANNRFIDIDLARLSGRNRNKAVV